MKSKIKKIGLISFISIFMLVVLGTMSSVKAYSRNQVIAYGGNAQTLGTDNDIILIHNKAKQHNGNTSALFQPNILCAQSGEGLSLAHYTIGGEQSVQDNTLAYILCHGQSMNSLKSSWVSSQQVALWKYLSVSSSSDRNNIVSGIGAPEWNGNTKNHIRDLYNKQEGIPSSPTFDEIWKAGEAMYQEATKAANTANVAPSLTTKLGNNGLEITVKGKLDRFKIYIDNSQYGGEYTKEIDATKTITIPYSDSRLSGKSQVSVRVDSLSKRYTAQYRILKSNADKNKRDGWDRINQRLMVVTVADTKDSIAGTIKKVDLLVDVSLQKYIVQVNGKNLTSAQTKLTNREDAYVSPTNVPVFNGKTDNRPNYYYDSPSNPAAKNKAKVYKRQNSSSSPEDENVVYIEAGDTVTYRIKVYNNDKIDATRFVIGDSYPSAVATWVGVKNASGQTVSWNKQNNTQYYYSIPGGLKAGTSTYFDVTLKYTKYTPNLITNCAYIEARNPNKTDAGYNFPVYTIPNAPAWGPEMYRSSDYDYIKMRPYKVSLEKFITKVEGGAGKNETPSPSRAGKRYNLNASNKSNTSNYNTWKDTNQYSVEPGDKITYTIRLANTGDYPVKISQITDTFWYVNGSNGIKLVYDSSYGVRGNGGGRIANSNYKSTSLDRTYLITFDNATLIQPRQYVDVTIRFTLDMPASTTNTERRNIDNTAVITELKNRNNVVVPDSDGTDNNQDCDIVKTKTYAVKLEKYISRVNNTTKDAENTTLSRSGKPEHANDNNTSTTNNWKSNNVAVVGKGDEVTYTITVTNEHANTSVYITNIKDTLPTGISQYKVGSGSWRTRPSNGVINITDTRNTFLAPGKSTSVTVTVKVSETNLSLSVFKNEAEITEMKNRNQVTVIDTTLNNNKDADYYELKDITIHGKVWNDKDLSKTATYNAVYDSGRENLLSGITVHLYRNNTKVATTTTNSNGEYTFSRSNLVSSLSANTRFIKGPRNTSGNNRWQGTYYSYYVVFEYDGITYTTTPNGTSYVQVNTSLPSNYQKDNNAREDQGPVAKTRANFNSQYKTINNSKGIAYNTRNESGYLPQSINSTKSAMQASTNLITLSNNANLEAQLQYVDCGLRGRDIFDLELTSDVYSTKVTVNGQTGEYSYNNNKVTVRHADIGVGEDMANRAQETRTASQSEVGQSMRKTDVDKSKTNSNYTSTGLGIEVTYKITVTNASQTDGTATKIADYYDSRYTFQRAYSGSTTLGTSNGTSGTGYKSVIITTPGTNLTQSKTMDIYVVLKLNTPETTLKSLANGTSKIPTYNMAEIYEYTTKAGSGQTEYTRGLLDKDSAPGSVGTEKVRLTTSQSSSLQTTNGTPTTVNYYFSKIGTPSTDLTKLKYEDDTYAAPTLYFGSSDNVRTLKGVVFRDKTTTDSSTRIKTGNGIKDSGEVGVYGATVELVELTTTKKPDAINNTEGTTRYTTTTDTSGNYTFTNFLPGNYVVRYHYGDTTKTVLLKQSGSVNAYSYNGEDYQSTNNTGTYGAKKLNSTAKLWYVFNETDGVSTGTDNAARRKTVSDNITKYTDSKMNILNQARAGSITSSNSNVTTLINDTNMYAATPNFTLTVEKTVKNGSATKQNNTFTTYVVNNMNFGVAEVPVTTINLQKQIKSFKITDSAGTNILAAWENGKSQGNVLRIANGIESGYDVSIEDEKLQGAKLQVTFDVITTMTTEKDFTNKDVIVPTIASITDFIDNDLSYNASLGQNSTYWEVTNFNNVKSELAATRYNGNNPTSTVDPSGNLYSTLVKAKANNPILLQKTGTASCPITLEKVLSSEDVTIGNIITSSINTYEYNNTVEITKLDYKNTNTTTSSSTITNRDRVRTTDRYIVLPGVGHDSATSDKIAIHPPTGENQSNTVYYVAAGALAVLVLGVAFIIRFAIKGKDEQ